ncbi:MAG TPA: GTPase, partial [Vicinamibacterales bacterium]|nr:GTPase [Vicinamibacterales bacterium]
AIVTEIPGTTRDLLTETVDVHGVPLTMVDTAGIRGGAVDPVEVEGIARAVAVRDVAHVVLVVLDRSRALDEDDRELLARTRGRQRVIVANKSDLAPAWTADESTGLDAIAVSALTGAGIDDLRAALVDAAAGGESTRDVPAITNVRHADLLRSARAALVRAAGAAASVTPEEFVVADLTDARRCLEEITGARTADDVLHAIFARFCIGK